MLVELAEFCHFCRGCIERLSRISLCAICALLYFDRHLSNVSFCCSVIIPYHITLKPAARLFVSAEDLTPKYDNLVKSPISAFLQL